MDFLNKILISGFLNKIVDFLAKLWTFYLKGGSFAPTYVLNPAGYGSVC